MFFGIMEIIIHGIQDFIDHLCAIRDNTNTAMFIFGVVLTCIFYPIGGINLLTVGLVIFMFFDYLTGIRRSQKLGLLSSSKGKKGIEKKIYMYVVIVMANIADKALNIDIGALNIRTAVTAMYLGIEGVSILENIEDMGYKTPVTLKKLFKLLISKGNEWRRNDDSEKTAESKTKKQD